MRLSAKLAPLLTRRYTERMRDLLLQIQVFFALKIWKKNPKALCSAIRGFQAVEADGVWHLHQLFLRTNQLEEKARIFQHLLEEDSHAEIFAKEVGLLTGTPSGVENFKRHDLTLDGENNWRAIAYLNVGEVDATRKFEVLARQLPESSLKTALEKICRDEAGHAHLTVELARAFSIPDEALREQIQSIRQKRFRDSVSKQLMSVLNSISLLGLALVYWLIGWTGFFSAKEKLKQRSVDYDNNFLKRFSH